MPIGFYSISRADVKQLLSLTGHKKVTRKELDYICRYLPAKIELYVLDHILELLSDASRLP